MVKFQLTVMLVCACLRMVRVEIVEWASFDRVLKSGEFCSGKMRLRSQLSKGSLLFIILRHLNRLDVKQMLAFVAVASLGEFD